MNHDYPEPPPPPPRCPNCNEELADRPGHDDGATCNGDDGCHWIGTWEEAETYAIDKAEARAEAMADAGPDWRSELASHHVPVPGVVPSERLEELREALRAESISYGELADLQELAPYIEPGDVELLEPAGVPEFDPPCPSCGADDLDPKSIEDGVRLPGGRWVGSATAVCRSCGWRGQLEWPWVPEDEEDGE